MPLNVSIQNRQACTVSAVLQVFSRGRRGRLGRSRNFLPSLALPWDQWDPFMMHHHGIHSLLRICTVCHHFEHLCYCIQKQIHSSHNGHKGVMIVMKPWHAAAPSGGGLPCSLAAKNLREETTTRMYTIGNGERCTIYSDTVHACIMQDTCRSLQHY